LIFCILVCQTWMFDITFLAMHFWQISFIPLIYHFSILIYSQKSCVCCKSLKAIAGNNRSAYRTRVYPLLDIKEYSYGQKLLVTVKLLKPIRRPQTTPVFFMCLMTYLRTWISWWTSDISFFAAECIQQFYDSNLLDDFSIYAFTFKYQKENIYFY